MRLFVVRFEQASECHTSDAREDLGAEFGCFAVGACLTTLAYSDIAIFNDRVIITDATDDAVCAFCPSQRYSRSMI